MKTGDFIPSTAEAKEAGTSVLAIGGGLMAAKVLNDQVLKTSNNLYVQIAWAVAGFLGASKLKGFVKWLCATISAYGTIRTLNILTEGTTVSGLGFIKIPDAVSTQIRKALPSLAGDAEMSDAQFAAIMAGLGNPGAAVQLPNSSSNPSFAGMENSGIPNLQLAGGMASVGVC